MVSIDLLGRARVMAGGQEIHFPRHLLTLLAYLALHKGIDHPREVLIDRFWSDQDPSKARSCLGSALCKLRKALTTHGQPIIEVASSGSLRVAGLGSMELDVDTFQVGLVSALAKPAGAMDWGDVGRLKASLECYRGDLLPGWYDDWALVERERLRNLCMRGYRRLMEYLAAQREFEDALAAGYAALSLEPLHENVQRRVIELLVANGERKAAIRQYEKLVTMLRVELGVGPASETSALIKGLMLPT